MKIFILLISVSLQECLKNCFLGSNFYSDPLDSSGCCRKEWNDNCERFIRISFDKFMCDKCRDGFKWINNKCINYDINDNCVNPEINSIPFY